MTVFSTPATTTEVLDILARYHGEARVFAGGTDLMPDLRAGRKSARLLVDITRIPELNGIVIAGDRVEVGAAVTFSELARHPYLRARVHCLAKAAAAVGAEDIRNVATWAGNLAQAMPAADGAIAALALDAEARVEDANGPRWQPVARLFAGPGRSTVDPTQQLITRIRFRIPEGPWGTAWRRIGRRDSLVLPILNCAVKLELMEDRITRAAIALGPAAPVPFRAAAAEGFLTGKEPRTEVFVEAAHIAQLESSPRSSRARASREYRLAALPALVQDALAAAAERAQER